MQSYPVIVVEREGAARRRLARVAAAIAGLAEVPALEHPSELQAWLEHRPAVVACGLEDTPAILRLLRQELPFTSLVVWSPRNSRSLLRAALEQPRLSSVLAWPSFASSPRASELAMVLRRLLDPVAPRSCADALLLPGAAERTWQPAGSRDAETVLAEVQAWAEKAGAAPRVAERIASVMHELLVNAIYAAPRDARGAPRYTYRRQEALELESAEVPTVRAATDGLLLTVQVADRFGGLERARVFEGIIRGLDGADDGADDVDQLVDRSRGGAGLGISRMHALSSALVVEVEPGRSTEVTAVFELEVPVRDLRGMPASVHYFER